MKNIIYLFCGVLFIFGFASCKFNDSQASQELEKLMVDYAKGVDTLHLPDFTYSYLSHFRNIQSVDTLSVQEVFFEKYAARLAKISRDEVLDPVLLKYYDALGFEIHLHLERIGLERNHLEKYANREIGEKGIYYVPNNKAWFRFFSKQLLRGVISPEDLKRLAEIEIKKAQDELRDLQEELGFNRDSIAFYENLAEETFKEDNPAKIYSLLASRRSIVKKNFDEFFFEKDCAHPKIRRNDRGDVFSIDFLIDEDAVIITSDGSNFNKRSTDVSYLEEGVPGRAYWYCWKELTVDTFPLFLDYINTEVYEGAWVAYVGELGGDLGLYRTLYDEIGYAEINLIYAIEMAVDVGINYLGWSDEKAKSYWNANVYHLGELSAEKIADIKAKPCRHLLYHYGKRKMGYLRNKSKETLGINFDLRVFHAEVLNQRLPF